MFPSFLQSGMHNTLLVPVACLQSAPSSQLLPTSRLLCLELPISPPPESQSLHRVLGCLVSKRQFSDIWAVLWMTTCNAQLSILLIILATDTASTNCCVLLAPVNPSGQQLAIPSNSTNHAAMTCFSGTSSQSPRFKNGNAKGQLRLSHVLAPNSSTLDQIFSHV